MHRFFMIHSFKKFHRYVRVSLFIINFKSSLWIELNDLEYKQNKNETDGGRVLSLFVV